MSGRRLTATARVALAISLVLAAAIVLLTLSAYAVTARNLARELDATLLREADAFGAAVKGAPPGQALVDATRVYLGARTGAGTGPEPILTAVFGDGRVLSNSELRLERASANIAAREATTTEGGFANIRYQGTDLRVLTTPIVAPSGQRLGVFQTALATTAANQVAQGVAAVVGGAGLAILGLGVLVSLWVSRRSLKPLHRMAEDAAHITHGTPDRRIAYDGPPDELGSLATSVNAMLDRLQSGAEEQRHFVADASHELRTPLAVIKGAAELATRSGVTESEHEEALRLIGEEADRMRRLIDDLLALARLEETGGARPQPLHAPTLAEEAAARARALSSVHVDHACSADAWVIADPDQLDQAIMNLVRNAVRVTPEDGSVRIACDAGPSTVWLSVTDTGPGIAASELPRVFDRFFRGGTERARGSEGAGLGLAITKRLVELQGGTIRAENVYPHGARFTIELPRTPVR